MRITSRKNGLSALHVAAFYGEAGTSDETERRAVLEGRVQGRTEDFPKGGGGEFFSMYNGE